MRIRAQICVFQDKELQEDCSFRLWPVQVTTFSYSPTSWLFSAHYCLSAAASLAANIPMKSSGSLKGEVGKLGGRTIRRSSREIMFAQTGSHVCGGEKPKEEEDVRRRSVKWKIELRSQVPRTIRKVSRRGFSTGEEFHRVWNFSRRRNRL